MKRTYKLLLLATLFLVHGIGYAQPSASSLSLNEHGLDQIKHRDFKAAAEAFKRAIEHDPNFILAYNNLGATYNALGCHSEAIKVLQKALSIQPDHAGSHFELGVALDRSHRYSEAVSAYRQAIHFDPHFVRAHDGLGVAYNKSRRIKESINAFQHALKLSPNHPEILNNLATAFAASGRYQEAIGALKKSISLKPNLLIAQYNLGLVHLLIKDRDGALEQFNVLKTLDSQTANRLYAEIYRGKVVHAQTLLSRGSRF